jgi:hypothetical protein
MAWIQLSIGLGVLALMIVAALLLVYGASRRRQ